MSGLASTLGTLLLAWVALNLLTFVAQPGMLFSPTRELATTPRDWGLDYRDLTLATEDGVRLHAWYIPRAGATRTLLFFHGNAGNVSHRGDSIAIFHALGLNVLIPDYRGYGRSAGRPSEAGIYRDARAAWAWLSQQGTDPADIVVFGRSLGASVAARLAAEVAREGPAPAGLILESGFSTAREAARAIFPVLARLVILHRYRLDSLDALAAVRCPVLVLHSPDDEIVPYALGRRLYAAANPPKRFADLTGGHNAGFLLAGERYVETLGEFLSSLPGGSGHARLRNSSAY